MGGMNREQAWTKEKVRKMREKERERKSRREKERWDRGGRERERNRWK